MEPSRAPLLAALAGLAALAALAAAAPARAAEPAMPTVNIEESEADSGTKREAAPDERKGHILLGVGAVAVGPAGSMGPATPSTTLAPAGFGVSGFLGVGLGRHASMQIFGDRTLFLSPAGCSQGCGGRAFSAGLGFTYHLAQGIAFDPWGSYGVAYRDSTFEVVNPGNPEGKRLPQHYRGIDWARISFGGDFYPTPFFGFGPWLEMDLGTNFNWPAPLVQLAADVPNSPRTYAMFQVGFRIAFDPMRKAPARSASATGTSVPRF